MNIFIGSFRKGKVLKAIRMGKWKGYLSNIKNGNRCVELYDLETDPQEQYNLSSIYPNVVKEIEKKMKKAHTESPVTNYKLLNYRKYEKMEFITCIGFTFCCM